MKNEKKLIEEKGNWKISKLRCPDCIEFLEVKGNNATYICRNGVCPSFNKEQGNKRVRSWNDKLKKHGDVKDQVCPKCGNFMLDPDQLFVEDVLKFIESKKSISGKTVMSPRLKTGDYSKEEDLLICQGCGNKMNRYSLKNLKMISKMSVGE